MSMTNYMIVLMPILSFHFNVFFYLRTSINRDISQSKPSEFLQEDEEASSRTWRNERHVSFTM